MNEINDDILIEACKNSNYKLVSYLIKIGIDIFYIDDNDGSNSLIIACKNGDSNIIIALLLKSIEIEYNDNNNNNNNEYLYKFINHKDKKGFSAIHYTINNNNIEAFSLITYFLKESIEIKDISGNDAIEIAILLNNINILKFIHSNYYNNYIDYNEFYKVSMNKRLSNIKDIKIERKYLLEIFSNNINRIDNKLYKKYSYFGKIISIWSLISSIKNWRKIKNFNIIKEFPYYFSILSLIIAFVLSIIYIYYDLILSVNRYYSLLCYHLVSICCQFMLWFIYYKIINSNPGYINSNKNINQIYQHIDNDHNNNNIDNNNNINNYDDFIRSSNIFSSNSSQFCHICRCKQPYRCKHSKTLAR
jgi:hypothetical protein